MSKKIMEDSVWKNVAGVPRELTTGQFAGAQLKFDLNQAAMERAYNSQQDGLMQYVVDRRNDLPEDQQKALAEGKLIAYPGKVYFTKQLAVGGFTDLIESSDDMLPGLKNFDSYNLPNEMSYAFNAIQLLYGVTAQPVTNLADVVFTSGIPTDFANGEFQLLRADIPVLQTVVEAFDQVVFADERRHLGANLLFTPKKTLKAKFGFNTGKTPSANTLYLKVILSGIQLKIQ